MARVGRRVHGLWYKVYQMAWYGLRVVTPFRNGRFSSTSAGKISCRREHDAISKNARNTSDGPQLLHSQPTRRRSRHEDPVPVSSAFSRKIAEVSQECDSGERYRPYLLAGVTIPGFLESPIDSHADLLAKNFLSRRTAFRQLLLYGCQLFFRG